jgi:hypothetical protein
MTSTSSIAEQNHLRHEIHDLAEIAFHHHLISGHGDGEYADKYQIIYQGKPRHFSLAEAHEFLNQILAKVMRIK